MLEFLDTPMLGIANSQTLRTVNFIVGLALLVMLFPKHGNLPEKPRRRTSRG